ncbi:MAG: hypothetical protein JRJ85_24330 [Deltaproteobacteria bacterium]|nr:hypothetical protein [Deltaproteobacteria bacterium]
MANWQDAEIVNNASSWQDAPVVDTKQPDIYSSMEAVMPGMSAVPRFVEGAYRGLESAKTGAQQLGNLVDPYASGEEKAIRGGELKSEIAMRDLRIGKLGKAGFVGSMVGEAAPSVMLPGGPAGGVVKRVLGGVASDVAASVADPVREDETRLGNLQRAATFSSVLRGGGSTISGAFRRLSNARAGNFADADIKELVDTADAEQIRIFFDDATQGTFAQKMSVAAEYLGRVGTGRGRVLQNEDAQKAALRWLDKVSGDFDDYAEVVQAGVGRKLDIFKKEAARKYARAAREIGDDAGEVVTKSFDNVSNSSIAAETAKGTRANKDVIAFLEKFRDAPRGDFNAMIEFRSDMLADFRNLVEDASVNHSSKGLISKAVDALDGDMSAFAKSHGAEGSWRAANKFYRETVVKFKQGKLKGLLNEKSAGNFDEQAAWKYLVQQSTNPKRARLMWQSLDSKGRNAVRFGLIKEAYDASTSGGGPFSPAKFAGFLEKRMPVVDQFFRGRTGSELKGLANVMRHVERAGQYAENPPTGQRLVPLLFAGAGYVEPTSVAAAGGVALTIKGLFQTKAGRNLLLSASTATPGSKAFDEIMQNLEKVAARASN